MVLCSWRTLRVQSTSQNRVSNDLGSAAVSSSSVADVAREQEVENDSNNQHKANEWWDNDGWEPEAVRRDDMAEEAFLAMDELEAALLEAGYTASASSLAINLEVEEEIASIDENGTTQSVGHGLPGNSHLTCMVYVFRVQTYLVVICQLLEYATFHNVERMIWKKFRSI